MRYYQVSRGVKITPSFPNVVGAGGVRNVFATGGEEFAEKGGSNYPLSAQGGPTSFLVDCGAIAGKLRGEVDNENGKTHIL